MTTHSPFFVLGMQQAYGDDGFVLCQLPHGQHISPEEFSEFGSAYAAISNSDRFAKALQAAAASSTNPLLVVEGKTDISYLHRAAKLLGREDTFARVELDSGQGESNLRKFWNSCTGAMAESLGHRVLLFFDCDANFSENEPCVKGNLVRQVIPQCPDHLVTRGIENRFGREALERARIANNSWFRSISEHRETVGDKEVAVPESWSVVKAHKSALCEWLCEHGTADDFEHFGEIFDLIDEALDDAPNGAD